ncbi:white collar 2 protein [Ephemerocybe angulata]|uniref:White collar 2 protein n=1 Tax=Ephemerocybe angulata TaxID=980116 RepID=A0A8H6MFH1_9AGAR|nr:white collar 2 protein [Tulosesus angulatus]
MSTSTPRPPSQAASGLPSQTPGPFDFPPDPPSSASKIAGQFDFTKKKRWADLAVADTVESVAFVINAATSTVLWCAPAIAEVLGWREADLIDSELTEYMNDEDGARFRGDLDSLVLLGTPLDTQVWMKVNRSAVSWTDSEEARVSLVGSTKTVEIGESTKITVVFLYAKHRTPEAPQALLALEMERMELELRLMSLRAEATPELLEELASSQAANEGANSFYTSSNLAAQPQEGEEPLEARSDYGPGPSGNQPSPDSSKGSPTAEEDAPEEGPKKKKAKKSLGEQHVCITCGRTDSPEWRKGPLGPKTLCNACGLRWAKQNRPKDDPETGAAKEAGEDSSSTPGSDKNF